MEHFLMRYNHRSNHLHVLVIHGSDAGFFESSQRQGHALVLEFQQGLIRWHYSGGSFIQPWRWQSCTTSTMVRVTAAAAARSV
jgi:hypothetical protein